MSSLEPEDEGKKLRTFFSNFHGKLFNQTLMNPKNKLPEIRDISIAKQLPHPIRNFHEEAPKILKIFLLHLHRNLSIFRKERLRGNQRNNFPEDRSEAQATIAWTEECKVPPDRPGNAAHQLRERTVRPKGTFAAKIDFNSKN
jgi:hypothetical protein